jgi:parvulin-like peptidyl-prolyl isomerase
VSRRVALTSSAGPCLCQAALRGAAAILALAAWPAAAQTLFDPPPAAQSGGATQPPTPTASPRQTPAIDDVTPTEAAPIEGAEVLARVDGQVILASDVLWQVNHLIAAANQKQIAAGRGPIPKEQIDQAQRELMSRLLMGLIDTKLLYADFRRTVPAENLPKIDESIAKPFEEIEVPRLVKMLNLRDRAELDAELRKHYTSLKEVQRQFTEKTIAGEWLKQRMPKPQPIAHDALLAYYHDHPKEFEIPAEIDWEELAVRFDRCGGDRDRAWRELCAMGNDVCQAARANPGLRGPVFAATAKARSHGPTAASGGLYEHTSPGAMKCEAINEALATLQVGQMSDGIESDVGFHIVRVLRRTEARRVPFADAQDKIRKHLEADQREAALNDELKELRIASRVWTAFHGDLNGPQVAALLETDAQQR